MENELESHFIRHLKDKQVTVNHPLASVGLHAVLIGASSCVIYKRST